MVGSERPFVQICESIVGKYLESQFGQGLDRALRASRSNAPLIIPTVEQIEPSLFTKIYPEIPLSDEHRRQALVLARVFATKLGFDSSEAYIATLPDFPDKPSTYDKFGLTVPVIFETRASWLEAAELSGIYVSAEMRVAMSAGEVRDWEKINFDTPKIPFTAWVQDGTKFVKDPEAARAQLGNRANLEYAAGSILLAVSVANVRPDMVRTNPWDVIGTAVDSLHEPYLYYQKEGRPFLGMIGFVGPHTDFRAFVHGRKIRTLDVTS